MGWRHMKQIMKADKWINGEGKISPGPGTETSKNQGTS
jgi:hypothetical protein